RRHAFPGGMGRLGRHPVDAVVGEKVDPGLPLLAVQQLRLAVEELLDRVLCLEVRHRHPFMYRAQAFIWLRIGASDVSMFGPLSAAPFFSMSRPKCRAKLTQSPPSDASPWWHFQKFSR